MIYNRNTYKTKHLRESDFINGIGYDTSLYNQILKVRNIYPRAKDEYWFEDDYSIDGSIRIKREHLLLNKIIQNKKTNEKYHIEYIGKHWYCGYYWTIIARKDGTKSHATFYTDNINCIDKTIIDGIRSFKKRYIVL
jgi:hypothetical protein